MNKKNLVLPSIFVFILALVATLFGFDVIGPSDSLDIPSGASVQQIRNFIHNNKVYDTQRGYWYVEVTPAQLRQASRTLRFNGVDYDTLPIDWYYHRPSGRLYFDVNRTELKDYIIEFKSNRRLQQKKNDRVLFNITTTADIEQVGLLQETGEWGYYSNGWENITYHSEGGLVVKGRHICYEDSKRVSGIGLARQEYYADCWLNPEKLVGTGVFQTDPLTGQQEEILEHTSIIRQIDSNTVIVSTYGDYDPLTSDYTSGLTSCYTFDTGIIDYTGTQSTGTTSSVINTTNSKIGAGSIYFKDDGDYVELAGTNSHFDNNNTWSYQGWLYVENYPASSTDIFMGFHRQSTASFAHYGQTFNTPTGRIETFIRNAAGSSVDVADTSGNPTNTWIHVAGVYNGSHMIQYINGTVVANVTTDFFGFGSYPLTLGAFYNGFTASRSLDGNWDEFSTWNVELTPSQISELYNSGSGVSCADISKLDYVPIYIKEPAFCGDTCEDSDYSGRFYWSNGTEDDTLYSNYWSGTSFSDLEKYTVTGMTADDVRWVEADESVIANYSSVSIQDSEGDAYVLLFDTITGNLIQQEEISVNLGTSLEETVSLTYINGTNRAIVLADDVSTGADTNLIYSKINSTNITAPAFFSHNSTASTTSKQVKITELNNGYLFISFIQGNTVGHAMVFNEDTLNIVRQYNFNTNIDSANFHTSTVTPNGTGAFVFFYDNNADNVTYYYINFSTQTITSAVYIEEDFGFNIEEATSCSIPTKENSALFIGVDQFNQVDAHVVYANGTSTNNLNKDGSNGRDFNFDCYSDYINNNVMFMYADSGNTSRLIHYYPNNESFSVTSLSSGTAYQLTNGTTDQLRFYPSPDGKRVYIGSKNSAQDVFFGAYYDTSTQTVDVDDNVKVARGLSFDYYNYAFAYTSIKPAGAVADTCTYSSGNWNVQCSDNCVISSPVNLGGNNLIISGSGTFTANAAISNVGSFATQCNAAFTDLQIS